MAENIEQIRLLRQIEEWKTSLHHTASTPLSRQNRERLSAWLRRLYTPNGSPLYFYAQDDESGFPLFPRVRVSAAIDGRTFHPQVISDHVVDQSRGFQNKNLTQLLKDPSARIDCLVCEQRDLSNKTFFECEYETWVEKTQKIWFERLAIRESPGKGYCLFARESIAAWTSIGEYRGELVKSSWKATASESAYWANIHCEAPRKNNRGGQTLCRIDGSKKGSLMRFASHSCSPNAQLAKGRVGSDRYAVELVSMANAIQSGEEITIDYGTDWFADGEYCLCGSPDCRKPAI
ncbi:unnamed protein product [Periconia digitata]|uniref:SET domain-containing protein n=1 Tax=Periconia digitata TaxID=1303443 RepID=A0A9W4U819_9PLEO|nr:unnamed protein product [Periconia digitata]